MSKHITYTCDSCGHSTENPYNVKFKEFDVKFNSGDGYEAGYWEHIINKRKIHLCRICFENLSEIGEKK